MDAVGFLQMCVGQLIAEAVFLQLVVFQPMEAVAFLYCFIGRLPVIIGNMSDNVPQATPAVSATSQSIPPQFASNPVKLLAAIADPVRWAVLRELAGGESLSVLELAGRLKQNPNLISKHLRWLREAGAVVVVAVPGVDGRKSSHAVPAAFLRKDANGKPEIDYGVCVLRFP
jgi:DNA-binding transcriptional ArsR family regulator